MSPTRSDRAEARRILGLARHLQDLPHTATKRQAETLAAEARSVLYAGDELAGPISADALRALGRVYRSFLKLRSDLLGMTIRPLK